MLEIILLTLVLILGLTLGYIIGKLKLKKSSTYPMNLALPLKYLK